MLILSYMSGAKRIPNSRDGARTAVGRERVRVYTHPKSSCSAVREKDAIVCGV